MTESMKLVVGLGNPGKKYDGTRHNVGWQVLATLSSRHGGGRPRAKFDAELVEIGIGQQRVLLACPLTYMNLSGRAVRGIVDFYKLSIDDVLVVCDDFNLPVGRIRFRPGGSSGGQKGLENIIQMMSTDQVPRLRIGVGPVPERWEAADFVLSRFTKQDIPEVEQTVVRAADGVDCWAIYGTETAMNRYNQATQNDTKSQDSGVADTD